MNETILLYQPQFIYYPGTELINKTIYNMLVTSM